MGEDGEPGVKEHDTRLDDEDGMDPTLPSPVIRARKRKVIFLLALLVLASISMAVLRLLLLGR